MIQFNLRKIFVLIVGLTLGMLGLKSYSALAKEAKKASSITCPAGHESGSGTSCH